MGVKLNLTVLSFFFLLASFADALTLDVRNYGAKADGQSDVSMALAKAWQEACAATTPTKIYIPRGNYRLSQASFKGPCKAPINIQLEGILIAPKNPGQFKQPSWVTFSYINRLTLNGGGTFDGQGEMAWARSDCSKTTFCPHYPMNLAFFFVTNSTVQDITNKNSKQFHTNVLGCKNFTFLRYTVNAPETSLNTDGIHIGRSDGVYIYDSHIKTGDDCISLGDGSKNIHIEGSSCGPGHGISIGSLGRYKNEEPVVGVYVKHCTISNTQNGVRIKTWPNSEPGTASDMHFEDVIMTNVSNPVLIDQVYCPWNQCSASIPSRVKLSNVSFKNIRGTSASHVAVKLSCSKAYPCNGVVLQDINLTYKGPEGPAISACSNVNPKVGGGQNPKACTTKAV
ncbi:Glyco_hydro_28 domain-containing protein [Cephalotus follicularis]|uniref:Glyco_hydro_28 domain-containing protein n=1 Tax=Cephalotus follicularis TaxID=3775 RepID=A0A1Q3C372_CEPFO|nr:Glyco_hydro_28 domain-containing protein [Cephalotus follicularis]